MIKRSEQPGYEELGSTAREYTLRMAQLTSHATTSYLRRELATAMNWFNSGLSFVKHTACTEDVASILNEQHKLTEDCQFMVEQDMRNALQIVELTKEEMFHWHQRWARALLRSAFAPYTPADKAK